MTLDRGRSKGTCTLIPRPHTPSTHSHTHTLPLTHTHTPRVRRYQGVGSVTLKENAVSVCFNKTGEQLFALYRGLSPCLFDLHEPKPVQCFVNDSYRNMVTLKSGCFMGPHDEVRAQSSSGRGTESRSPVGSVYCGCGYNHCSYHALYIVQSV